MQVSISGSSGFTGKEIIGALDNQGYDFTVINRDSFTMSDEEFLLKKIEGKDAVIHLAGSPILRKWNDKVKADIISSRVDTAGKIVRAIRYATVKPRVLISASAVGIYSSSGTHSETSTSFADDFQAEVCREWEAAAMEAADMTRVVIVRTGVVLGISGGALPVMEKPFRMALGGKIGKGTQSFSWIHIRDLIGVYKKILEDETISGPVNAVAPNPVSNEYFTKVFAKVLNQPAVFTIPVFAIKMLYGDAASVITEGQNVIPEKLLSHNFSFQYPTIEKALLNLYKGIV